MLKLNKRLLWNTFIIRYLTKAFYCNFSIQSTLYHTCIYNRLPEDEPSVSKHVEQCFSTAGTRPGTGPCHQLYRAARGSPAICHFSFLSNFHEQMFYGGNILRIKISVNVSKKLRPRCCPEETTVCYKISLVQWLITNLKVILYLSTCHTIYISVLVLFMIMP